MSHICTNESLVAGGFEVKLKCSICLVTSIMKTGYVGSLCSNCGHLNGDDWAGNIAKLRRERLKMTRREWGNLLKLSPNTIKKYEFVRCPKDYLKKTEKIVLSHSPIKSETDRS